MTYIRLTSICLLMSIGPVTITPQSAGSYALTQTVIAGGGGQSSGDVYTIGSTIGQHAAGRSAEPPYDMHIGFWTPAPLAPTAARVSISGRVQSATGGGIRNAILTMISAGGQVTSTRTTAFGYYVFQSVLSGEDYVITVSARRATFASPSRNLTVVDQLDGIDFVADP